MSIINSINEIFCKMIKQGCSLQDSVRVINKYPVDLSLERYKETGKHPVVVAVECGRLDIMEILIKRGCSPSADYTSVPNSVGNRVRYKLIHVACKAGSLPVMKSLVEAHNVDVNAVDSHGSCALSYAMQCERTAEGLDLVKYLFDYTDYRVCFVEDSLPVHQAAKLNKWDICLYLIANGFDANGLNSRDDTPLAIAIQNGSVEGAKALIAAGADVNHRLKYGSTLLHLAVWCCDLTMVKMLCSCGIDPEGEDNHGSTALHYALQGSPNFEIVRYLVVHMNVCLKKTYESKTTLDIACTNQLHDIVRLLIDVGCDPPVGTDVWDDYYRSLTPSTSVEAFLRNILSSPRTLQKLCCLRIRDSLGIRAVNKIDDLPLPPKLKLQLLIPHVQTVWQKMLLSSS